MKYLVRGALVLVTVLVSAGAWAAETGPDKIMASTADHSTFQVLQQDFKTGPEVTKACLTCHTNAAKQVMKTEHWTWEYRDPKTHKLEGKRHVINDFCTSPETNQYHCTECHVGYNWRDSSFNFSAPENETNVDCLVCHASTRFYKKDGDNYGEPLKWVNLKKAAMSVAMPSRENCGECHFNGGGGDGTKHGDLDSTLAAPAKAEDVHMDAKGLQFECVTCHKAEGHQVPGSRYSPTAMDKMPAMIRGDHEHGRNPVTCQSCHGQKPHKLAKMNDHTDKIACQTCHIPAFARGGQPTRLTWDWSTAGKRDKNGKAFDTLNDDGFPVYRSVMGTFTWQENVVPEYLWFNGTVNWLTVGEKFDPSKAPITINTYEGSSADGKSMIWPVKIFRGKQMYDSINNYLIVAHLAGNAEDPTAYWVNLDWDKAITDGMKRANLPYSGKYGFIATQTIWPITHMVAPKEKALACADCHASNGRLEQIKGIYIPGRGSDHLRWLEFAGWTLAALTLLVALVHGMGRIIASSRRK